MFYSQVALLQIFLQVSRYTKLYVYRTQMFHTRNIHSTQRKQRQNCHKDINPAVVQFLIRCFEEKPQYYDFNCLFWLCLMFESWQDCSKWWQQIIAIQIFTCSKTHVSRQYSEYNSLSLHHIFAGKYTLNLSCLLTISRRLLAEKAPWECSASN